MYQTVQAPNYNLERVPNIMEAILKRLRKCSQLQIEGLPNHHRQLAIMLQVLLEIPTA
jgi:hypothetical protein